MSIFRLDRDDRILHRHADPKAQEGLKAVQVSGVRFLSEAPKDEATAQDGQ